MRYMGKKVELAFVNLSEVLGLQAMWREMIVFPSLAT